MINLDLGEAVRCYEVFLPTGRDKNLINLVNEAKINPAYNTIRDSLHRSIITSLCRIWDKSRSTNNILNLLTFLRRDAKSGKNGLEVGSLLDLESRAYKVNISSEFQAIQQIRHRIIAHTADPDRPYLAMARQAVYGDERIVIDMSISIIEELNDLAGLPLKCLIPI